MTELQDSSTFKLSKRPNAPLEGLGVSPYSVAGIGFQMNLDQTVVSRSVYTFLDVLSDVGGLESIIISFIATILSILNYNNFDSHLVSHLFKPRGSDERNFSAQKDVSGIREYLNDKLPSKVLLCLKRNKQQEMINRARESLDKETDIVTIVK